MDLLSVQHINPVAASLIQKMLQHDPAARPTIDELLNEEFFTTGYIPSRLPTTCLTVPPRFSLAPSSLDPSNRRPLAVVNKGELGEVSEPPPPFPGCAVSEPGRIFPVAGPESPALEKVSEKEDKASTLQEPGQPLPCYLADLLQQLMRVNACRPSEKTPVRQGEGGWLDAALFSRATRVHFFIPASLVCFFPPEEAEDPACIPIFWVSKWVDYSDKYGLGR